ncbi:MAG: SUMF1/EgtB/PvdO family nonheme iron enzyme [Phycisphaerales bacterium]|jgi:formylglycine-generating enzyme required for sulfatase activity|nr:SUMF1/EgtB/PvdO family nonheme iron enzyme [Phycisphaerales bacterium]
MWRFVIAGAAVPVALFMSSASAAVTFNWAAVGDSGNAADTTGFGSVAHDYSISKTEVTNGQYTEFLNAVASTDTYGLYDSRMNSDGSGGITQSGSSGSYTYAVKSGRGNMPVNFVSWKDAARFVNWLSNGQGSGGTETGTYNMSDSTITRAGNASYVLPTEDEWYKAAYYDQTLNSGAGGYYDYATRNDTAPSYGYPPGGSNSANYKSGDGWKYPGDTTTDVGAYTGSTSYYGTFDQSGNVWEWNETEVTAGKRGMRGGQWASGSSDLNANTRNSNSLNDSYSSAGFRVAAVPEPTSGVVLLTLGGLALLRRRRSA